MKNPLYYIRVMFNLFRKSRSQPKSEPESTRQENIFPIFSYHLTLDENGDVYLETECYNFHEDSTNIIATLLFLLNSGKLMELHVESIKTWAENDTSKQEFVNQIISIWHVLIQQTVDNNTTTLDQPVVHPLTALESDMK